jgi:DNA-binding transcriptional LysR family regulator
VAPPGATASAWDTALTSLPFLRFNRNSGMNAIVDLVLRRAGLSVTDAMELDSSDAMLSMVGAGLGAGVVPAGRVDERTLQSLRVYPFGAPPVSRRVVFTERRNNQRSDLARVLYAELSRLIGVD